MAQSHVYTVRMVRPDRFTTKTRKLFLSEKPASHSLTQLTAYLTHTLFSDSERGGLGTVYEVTEKIHGKQDRHWFVVRTSSGYSTINQLVGTRSSF